MLILVKVSEGKITPAREDNIKRDLKDTKYEGAK
jgi:hypothetical protein